ncbi:hypothetical protein LI328DRAFT_171483 [Trichoderma asperelloides]|nr:hypothetical protein LI328DRAFT_171483 [Trichoderma asperelloides]
MIENDSKASGGASKTQRAAIASLLAGATEAFRVAKEPGGWRGEKTKRILTAAAAVDALDTTHGADHGKLGLAESIISGLISNRLINGSRNDVEDNRVDRSRSQSPAQSEHNRGGQSKSPAERPQSATHPTKNSAAIHRPSVNTLVATETELSPISPVDEPTTTVYCHSCLSGYTIQMFRGPVEYLPCKHYICHTCLVQLLALSLLSPTHMPIRCCCDSLEEISKSKFTRILLDPRIANIWDIWEDLKLLKESGWTCANGHFSPKDSLLVTNSSVPIWKHPVRCSACAKSERLQQAEFCLLCGEVVASNGCGCRFNEVIASFLEILFTSGALKAETKLSAELWTAIRTWDDLSDRSRIPFGFRPWKDGQFLEPGQQNAKPASRPRSMEPPPRQRSSEPILRQRSAEPGIKPRLAETLRKPQCYACGARIANTDSARDSQSCTCGAHHCSRCGTKWKQCSCPLTSSRNKQNRPSVLITQHQDKPQNTKNDGFKDRSPIFSYVEAGSKEKLTPRHTYSRSEGSHSQGGIPRQDTYIVEPGTRRNHAYEDVEYVTSQTLQNSGRSLEPSSAHHMPRGSRTYYNTPRTVDPRSAQSNLSRYAEESSKAQNSKRKPRDGRTYF